MAQEFTSNYMSTTYQNKFVVSSGSPPMKKQDSSAKFILLLNNKYLTTGQTWDWSTRASSCVVPYLKLCRFVANDTWFSVILYHVDSKFVHGVIYDLYMRAKIDYLQTGYYDQMRTLSML